MTLLLPKLATKSAIDDIIRKTEDKVLVLRFGREIDITCMQLDEIVSTDDIEYLESKHHMSTLHACNWTK